MGKTVIGDLTVNTPDDPKGRLSFGNSQNNFFSYSLSVSPLAGSTYQQTITGTSLRRFILKRLVWGAYVTDNANAPKELRYIIGKIATTGAPGLTSVEPIANATLGSGFSRVNNVRFMNQNNGFINQNVNIPVLPNQTFEITLLIYTVAAMVVTDVIEGSVYLEYE